MLQTEIKKEKPYIYVFVRKDLPLEQIIVQTNHSVYESGLKFKNPHNDETLTSIIVIAVKDKIALEKAYQKFNNILELARFEEPDWDYGLTSFATRPVFEHERHIFKNYQLFKHQ